MKIKAFLIRIFVYLFGATEQLYAVENKDTNHKYAENQDEYLTLPVHKLPHDEYGRIITTFHVPLWQRLRVLFKGKFYVMILTFNKPLQPLSVFTYNPVPAMYLPQNQIFFERDGVTGVTVLKHGQRCTIFEKEGVIVGFKNYSKVLVKIDNGSTLVVDKGDKSFGIYPADCIANQITNNGTGE